MALPESWSALKGNNSEWDSSIYRQAIQLLIYPFLNLLCYTENTILWL